MRYRRMPIEIESPEQLGYDTITNNLSESSVADQRLSDLGLDLDLDDLLLCYGDHLGHPDAPASRSSRCGRTRPVTMSSSRPARRPPSSASRRPSSTPGDHAVVLRTNYATNIETPRRSARDIDFIDLRFDDGWALDLDRSGITIRSADEVGQPHLSAQPDRAVLTPRRAESVIDIVDRSNAVLLFDETYRTSQMANGAADGVEYVRSRGQRRVPVEGLWPAGPPHRMARLP